LLDSSGKLKVCDFGCSKQYTNAIAESGMIQSAKGSLPWMAPEVMKQGGYGRKADIWSVGCLVIEMISGKPPWSEAENHVALMMRVLVYCEMPQIPSCLSEIGKDFVRKCLNREPSKRSTADELMMHPFIRKTN
jgi:serine/threonine protein kinase